MSSRPAHFLKSGLHATKVCIRKFATSSAKCQMSKPPTSTRSAPSPSATAASSRARLSRLNARLPPFLQSYTTPLLRAPTTHITSFLLLHELTAVIPLFGFAGLFYYSGWSPDWAGEWKGVDEGVQRFTRYFRRKGWISEQDEDDVKSQGQGAGDLETGGKEGARVVLA